MKLIDTSLSNGSITINEAMLNVRCQKYVIPAFQRNYVWTRKSIEDLWESILLGYPISTFLFWTMKTSNLSGDPVVYKFCPMIQFRNGINGKPNTEAKRFENIDLSLNNIAVLDGQQRLTSLYISLYGKVVSANGNRITENTTYSEEFLVLELDKNKFSFQDEYGDHDDDENDDIYEEDQSNFVSIDGLKINNKTKKIFDIKFVRTLGNSQFEVKEILEEKYKNNLDQAIEDRIKNIPANSKKYASALLRTLFDRVHNDRIINFTQADNMTLSDAVEMFVRFNSYGKKLSKAEITMSQFCEGWNGAKEYYKKVLSGRYKGFELDFIIRTAQMLWGDVTKSDYSKQVENGLKNHQDNFINILKDLDEMFEGMNIDITRFANSWNVLVPIIYIIANNPDYLDNKDAIRTYLIRASLFGFFKNGTLSKLKKIKDSIDNTQETKGYCGIDLENIAATIPELRYDEYKINDILELEYKNKITDKALYFLNLKYNEKNASFDKDHLQPKVIFGALNRPEGFDRDLWNTWTKLSDKLPNLWYSDPTINRGKGSTEFSDFYNNLPDSKKSRIKDQAMIPEVPLDIQHFGDFYEARKEILKEKLRELLGGK